MQAAHDAGFRAIALSALWEPGGTADAVLPPLRRAVKAAVAKEIAPVLFVYQLSSNTPLDPTHRSAFAAFAATLARKLPDVRTVIVGNEPNLNLFWLPQFGPDGSDAAATAYEQLLAETYDALKHVDSGLEVVGGALAPRGSDDPNASRQTHSPTQFILDLGRAYRASGRDRPLMDAFSLHPYGESPRVPPTLRHPHTTSLGIADYPKLVRLLGRAFDGTAQPGSKLPVLYAEYGVETTDPAGQGSCLHRERGGRAGRRLDTGALLHRGDPPRAAAADRRRDLHLPRRRRDAARGPAERGPLRGRDAEGEPRGGSPS